MPNGRSLTAGKLIDLPCEIGQGASPLERWVRIEARNKPVTAFVQSQFVTPRDDKRGQVSVLIRNVETEDVLLWVFGEVLSSSNPVRIDRDWVYDNYNIPLR
jgi:hypothetical protein